MLITQGFMPNRDREEAVRKCRNRILRRKVARHNVKAFVSAANIRGAQQWHDEIGAALKRCDWFLLVLSPQSVRSIWVKHELIYALQASRYRGRIIPILYRQCDQDALSWTLSSIESIDFRGDFDDACRRLFRIWELEYSPE